MLSGRWCKLPLQLYYLFPLTCTFAILLVLSSAYHLLPGGPDECLWIVQPVEGGALIEVVTKSEDEDLHNVTEVSFHAAAKT